MKRLFTCSLCPYRTNRRNNLKRHTIMVHEQTTAVLECCGTQFANKAALSHHTVAFHSRGFVCNVCGAVFYRRFLFRRHHLVHSSIKEFTCQSCDYATRSKNNLERHMKIHKKKRKKNLPLKKSGLKVAQEEHQDVSEETREEWYIPASGRRRRYIYCKDCDFKTGTRTQLNRHVKAKHPRPKKARASRRNHSSPNQEPSGMEDPEEIMRKQFGIKECRVILHKIKQPSVQVTNPENTEQLPPNDEVVDEIDDENGNQRGERKIQLLKIQINSVEERVRIAKDKVKQISSKKMDVQKQIEDILGRRALIECNLKIEQCNLFELGLSELETGEEPSEMLKQSVEEEVKNFEGQMDVIDGELRALKEEESSLDQNLKDARSSHVGVVQVLEGLQSELDGLLLDICV